jgi:hypothetical protein
MTPVFSLDPFSWINAWRRDTKLFEWAVLNNTLLFSGVVSFLIGCGAVLAGAAGAAGIAGAAGYHLPPGLIWPAAVGAGMLKAAVSMTKTWRDSPLTKGTTLALPAEEASQELASDMQVIRK